MVNPWLTLSRYPMFKPESFMLLYYGKEASELSVKFLGVVFTLVVTFVFLIIVTNLLINFPLFYLLNQSFPLWSESTTCSQYLADTY